MAENNYNRYVFPRNPVNIKKYFYVLRPLLNILWLNQKKSIPPMQFIETLNALDLPTDVLETTHELLEQKSKTSEMGKGPKIPILENFIQEQLELAQKYCESAPVGHVAMDALNKLFRQTINESWEN
jgi:predicted nucleotidyltransferase